MTRGEAPPARPDGADTVAGRLRRARHRRFVGRSREIELFAGALTAPGEPFTVLFVHGPGGAGKTRLGLALADWLREEGWYAGPLREFVTTHDQAHQMPSVTWLAEVTAR